MTEHEEVCSALEQLIRVVDNMRPATVSSNINPLYLERRKRAVVLTLKLAQNELQSWFDLLDRASGQELNAREYAQSHGSAVEDWLAGFLETQFGRVVEGEPRAVSQFGVPYQTTAIVLDTRDGHERMMASLRAALEAALPPDHQAMTLVWRVRPQLVAMSPDFENNITHTYDVRIRYRSHTLPGIDVEPAPEIRNTPDATA